MAGLLGTARIIRTAPVKPARRPPGLATRSPRKGSRPASGLAHADPAQALPASARRPPDLPSGDASH